jgi:hypothetical protein
MCNYNLAQVNSISHPEHKEISVSQEKGGGGGRRRNEKREGERQKKRKKGETGRASLQMAWEPEEFLEQAYWNI